MEDEAAVIRSWYEHVLVGGSLAGLRADLIRRGVPSPTGKQWRTPVIRRILLHPRNAGLRVLGGAEYPVPHPPIVPVDTWRAAVHLLTQPDRATHQLGTARKHLGTGLYVCGRCQHTVNSGYHQGGARVYKCPTCYRSWRADPIDGWVSDLVAALVSAEDARRRLLPKPTRKGVDVKALRTEAAAIRVNMAALAEEFATAKGATQAALRKGMATGEARLAEIRQKLTAAGRTNPLAGVVLADDPAAAWLAIEDIGRRQTVIRALMTITLRAPLRGRVPWDASKFIDVTPKKIR